MQEDVVFFMIFTGLTAPLSYAYRMIFDGVPQMHPWDLRIVRHTASGSLSESPGGVRPEYPASGRHYGRAVSSGSRIRIRPIGGSL